MKEIDVHQPAKLFARQFQAVKSAWRKAVNNKAQNRNHQSKTNKKEQTNTTNSHKHGCFLFYSSFMSTHNNSTKAIFYALGANAGIAIAKFSAALFTGSGAMLAEAIHSLADCANQIFLLRGLREAKKPADASHPMGYG